MSGLENFGSLASELRRTADIVDACARREAEARSEATYYKKLYTELRKQLNQSGSSSQSLKDGGIDDQSLSTGSDRSEKSMDIPGTPTRSMLSLTTFDADPTLAPIVSPGRNGLHLRQRGFSVTLRDRKASDSCLCRETSEPCDISEGQPLTERSLSMYSEDGRSMDSLSGVEPATSRNHGVCTTHWKGTNYYLTWHKKPKTALVLCKTKDRPAILAAVDVCNFLRREHGIQVYVEPKVVEEEIDLLRGHELTHEEANSFNRRVRIWKGSEGDCAEEKVILDFGVVLGGDGTVLWASNLFPEESVPPLVAFGLGTLSFMCANDYRECKYTLHNFLNGPSAITLRHRLTCCIVRDSDEADAGDLRGSPPMEQRKLVLNDVVIDRGVSPYLTNLECYCDDVFVTTVRGDGLIVATPSGSTAYSLAAGGSMVHPQVPCILFTPICPHSLSFRPLAFPNTIRLKIRLPEQGKSTAWVSFDGKGRQQLSPGDAILIEMSDYPLPTVCATDPTSDWFRSVTEDLQWNTRESIMTKNPAGRLSRHVSDLPDYMVPVSASDEDAPQK